MSVRKRGLAHHQMRMIGSETLSALEIFERKKMRDLRSQDKMKSNEGEELIKAS
jgi:hypothetical protein